MLCKVCGAEISDDAQKCEFCGAILTEAIDDVADTADMMEETKVIDTDEVEKAYEENADELGDDFRVEDESEEEIYDENERKRRAQIKRMMEDKKQQLTEIERRRNEKRRKQRRNRIALIVAVCALVVLAAGVGAYYFAMNISGGDSDVTPTPSMPVVSTPTTTPSASPSVEPTESPQLDMTTEPKAESENTTASSGTTSSGTSSNTNKSWTAANGSSSSTKSNTSSDGGSTSASKSTSSSASTSSSNKNTQPSTQNTTSAAKDSGVTTSNISSQLSTGGEVIYNSGTGRYLMTFVTNNTKYYATVSAGSTTDQVKGKSYTITANPTSETYNGNTVYDITSMAKYDGDYILSTSGTKLLTNYDISGLSKRDLALARNEIYARHGRKFQTEEYSKYFASKSWYSINPNYNYADDESNLNSIEIKNVQFILNAEKK